MNKLYVIQVRQKGHWGRWIACTTREGGERTWRTFGRVNKCAARFVEADGDRVKVLATKRAGTTEAA